MAPTETGHEPSGIPLQPPDWDKIIAGAVTKLDPEVIARARDEFMKVVMEKAAEAFRSRYPEAQLLHNIPYITSANKILTQFNGQPHTQYRDEGSSS
jgi:hypothetical protein